MKSFPSGRMGDSESPAKGLSASLRAAGFGLGRLKTGTPARLDKNTIDFSNMEEQPGDEDPQPFSYLTTSIPHKVSASGREFTGSEITTSGQSNKMLSY